MTNSLVHLKRRRSRNELIAAMMDPAFYPRPPAFVIHKETHVSDVFLAGDLVYKLKKSVRYPFVDYSTLDKRLQFLEAEFRLNRRLAPSVYLAVMPITCDSLGWRLGGWSDPCEYALIMRRLPEASMLTALVDSGGVDGPMMRRLAEVVAEFHLNAERVTGSEAAGHSGEVERQWNENLAELPTAASGLTTPQTVKAFEEFGAAFIGRHRELLQRRAREGWIRDVHGDLHCEHICFAPEGIEIYDCIEFSAKLRRCDLASEIAFLLMDLEVRGGRSFCAPFLNRYLEIVNDPELRLLLPFYQCYRALVRAKVEALRPETAPVRAPRYFRYALGLISQRMKPFLLLIYGLTGSGKSTLARELAHRLKIPLINSDAVRKSLSGESGGNVVPFGEGIYSPSMTEKTYARMIELAGEHIRNGEGALLDATFSRKQNRREAIRLAERFKLPVFAVHCFASDDATESRLIDRAADGKDLSDGHWEIYLRQKQQYEPLSELPPGCCLELNTEDRIESLADKVENFLRSRITGGHRPPNV